MFAFGVVSTGTAFVRSFSGLCVARAFLGLAEGGTMPVSPSPSVLAFTISQIRIFRVSPSF